MFVSTDHRGFLIRIVIRDYYNIRELLLPRMWRSWRNVAVESTSSGAPSLLVEISTVGTRTMKELSDS